MSADEIFLEDALRSFRKLKWLAEAALAQVSDEDYFRTLGPESNSLATIVKHLAGNSRSRWKDFLTADGEKPDRNRDAEFVVATEDTRAALTARWEAGWEHLFTALEPLKPADLERTITIRGEPHTVVQAMNRQLSHYAYHVGQIVLLAKHFAGARWQTLSIARGKSQDFNAEMQKRFG